MDQITELVKYKLDPTKLVLESLVGHLPAYFKSQNTDALYQWACIPCRDSWAVVLYLYRDGRNTIHMKFMYPDLATAICYMLLWLLNNEIVSYHQLIEFI